ncbi:MAG: hypothetical protein Q8L14_35965 [Myxococcales bacterium]|nr:hypothetical protein [Myxococcales bacterium]
MRLALKLLLTVPVVAILAWSLESPRRGVFGELEALGPAAPMVAAAFFLVVVLYCRDLVLLMRALDEEARAASPASMWWMLVLPLNFVEDFSIVSHVSTSLERQWRLRPELAGLGTGRMVGLSWCALQIVSLVPSTVGLVAGVLAVPPWLWHWRFIRAARQRVLQPRAR